MRIDMAEDVTLSPDQFHKLQAVLLELLCEVRRICDLAEIHYTIIAGTMLGAVRHSGFVPWDDDGDVAMFRDDYEAFSKACEQYLDTTRFYFQDHVHTEGYRWGYGKLRRKDSSYILSGAENLPYEQGICIDIFPLDHVPDSRPGRAVSNFHCFLIRKFLYAEAGKYRERNFMKRALYTVMSKVPVEVTFAHYARYIRYRNRKRTDWVRILMFPTPNREYGYLRKWYEQVSEITFEDEVFAGIHDYDEYLTFKFGNYLEFPPLDERMRHHVSELKFTEQTEGTS